jgi:hypothetical protein
MLGFIYQTKTKTKPKHDKNIFICSQKRHFKASTNWNFLNDCFLYVFSNQLRDKY